MEDDEKPLLTRAAGGVSSSVIKTSNTGLNTGSITLPCGDAAFIVRPKQEGNCPVILLAHEIFGLHELILDLAHHLARGGYLVIAPDYVSRYGDIVAASSIDALRLIIVQASDDMTLKIFDKAFASAAYDGGDLHRVAMTGFCWGGHVAWLYGAYNGRIHAFVAWYGRPDGERAPKNYWPIDLAGQVQAPTPGLYGGADPTILRELIVKFQDQLYKNGAPA